MKLDVDTVLLRIGSGQLSHVFHQAAQVYFLEVKVARPGEIDQGLYYAIQTADLCVDDVHVTPRIGLLLRQFVSQQLQMKHDRVDRILYLMGHAPGKAPAGGEASRHFNFIAYAPSGFRVPHNQESADLGVPFLHEVERNLHALSPGRLKLPLGEWTPAFKSLKQRDA
jgi:hypothetical protein